MSGSRKLRSNKDVNLSMLVDTPSPRRSSKGKDRLNLTSTPSKRESAEMERPSGSSRAVSRRQSRQLPDQEDDFSDHDVMENGDQTIHSRNLINNNNSTLRFDDKPEHLYGLDNPNNISSDKEDNEQKTKPDENTKPVAIKFSYKFVCICFCFLAVLGILMSVLADFHNQKQLHEENTAEITFLKNRISKLENMLSHQGINSVQDQTYKNVFPPDQSVKCDGHQSEKLIEQALRHWDADKIGIPDYALESAGGQIHSSYHSATFANGAPQVLAFGVPLWYDVKTPRVIIQPGNIPGECWAFQGSTGFVVIKLSQMIKPTSFTLEHMAASLSQFGDQSIPSAPKEFSVWGWSDAHGNDKVLLGEYVYDHRGYALQSFPVQATTVPDLRFIELRVHSNYGNPSYTCLYRFRVHGSPYKNNN